MNRRTVVKGAAWSIPLVAAAVAVPMAAASGAENVALVTPSISSAQLYRGLPFTTQVCIVNYGTTAATGGQTILLDYLSDTVNPAHIKVVTPGWTLGRVELTPGDRLQIPLIYAGDLAPSETACVEVENIVNDCPSGGRSYLSVNLNGAIRTTNYEVLPSPAVPTIRPVGVSDAPNGNGTGSEHGSVRQGDMFQLRYQLFNPGMTDFTGHQNVHIDLPDAFGTPADITLTGSNAFTLTPNGASPEHGGYRRYQLDFDGALTSYCVGGMQVAEALVSVRAPAGIAQQNYVIYSRVYGAVGTAVERRSGVLVLPPI